MFAVMCMLNLVQVYWNLFYEEILFQELNNESSVLERRKSLAVVW